MRSVHRFLLSPLILVLAAACHDPEPAKTPQGSIKDVVVVLKGSDEPLPFDPRGGRITIVTQELTRLVGHPIILELDSALSPELKASLEETVLASFETLARELVRLQKEDPEMFAKARQIERVVCKYDAVAKESEGKLESGGKILAVLSPPERFPLLERGVVTEAVYFAYIGDLDARWGDADPTRLPAREQSAYFSYMISTRPGAGYLWIAARAKKSDNAGGRPWDELRVEHVERILRLAGVVERGSPLEKKVRRFLLEHAIYVGGLEPPPSASASANARSKSNVDPNLVRRVTQSYGSWLEKNHPSFDDEDRSILSKAIFERQAGMACRTDECPPDAAFPSFDRFAFGLSIYDAWVKDGAKIDNEPAAHHLGRPKVIGNERAELYKKVICPTKRRGEAETEIRYSCGTFFPMALTFDRARLSDTIVKRRDTRLLEVALLNIGHKGGANALALVESFSGKDDGLFRLGAHILFHDYARRDDVKSALEEAAPRWWRDTPSRKGYALLVMARKTEGLHQHYGDNHWTRFTAEFGGPIQRDVLGSYLSEGSRAVDMVAKIWPALAKNTERDEIVAKSLHVLLTKDSEARTSRTTPVLTLLRARLCEEKNAAGLAAVRASIDRWVKDHPDDKAAMSNALADFTLARCAQPPKESTRD